MIKSGRDRMCWYKMKQNEGSKRDFGTGSGSEMWQRCSGFWAIGKEGL